MGIVSSRSFDNGNFMVHLLGTLWDLWFPEREYVQSLMTARGEPYWQVYLDLLDLVASKSRFNIPVFKKRYWEPFTVLESQKDLGAQRYNLYGTSELTYENNNKPAYGDKEDEKFFSYTIDSDIVDVHAVYNRVIDPSLIWMNNSDFVVDGDRHIISFYEDPFENDLVPKRDVLDSSGNVTDREISLWLNFADIDIQLVYEQFGYAVGVWMKSSTFYKEFISAIWDSLILGPTEVALKLAFSALTGIPFAQGNETVEAIIDESPTYKHVQTDKNLYTFTGNSTILVSVGQVLAVGDTLSDGLQIFEPPAGLSSFPGMAISEKLRTNTGLTGPIVFDNAEMNVTYVGIDANNKAIVQFEVSGFEQDITKFWANSHKEGLNTGITMADALDVRTVKISPTTLADLPATINPFEFAVTHIFDNNLFLVHAQPSQFAEGAPGLGALDMLYPFLPAHTAYIIFVEIQQDTDYYNVVDQDDSLGFFKGIEVVDTVSNNFAVDIGPTIWSISGRCK